MQSASQWQNGAQRTCDKINTLGPVIGSVILMVRYTLYDYVSSDAYIDSCAPPGYNI